MTMTMKMTITMGTVMPMITGTAIEGSVSSGSDNGVVLEMASCTATDVHAMLAVVV